MSTRRAPAGALAVSIVLILAACGARVASTPAVPRAEGVGFEAAVRRQSVADLGLVRPAPEPQPATLAPVRRALDDPRWALVVGIDDYPGTRNDLGTAVADARTMAGALRGFGFPSDHVRVLTDGRATADAVLDGVRWLAARTGPGATGVLLFAGHALQVSGRDDGDAEALDEAFVASDFGYVLDGALAEALRPARGSVWLAFATCHAAGFADAAAPGRVLSFASAENALAYEAAQLGGSFFVEFLVDRAMIGAGVSTPEAAHRRARTWMTGAWRQYRPLVRDLHPGPLPLATRLVQAGI